MTMLHTLHKWIQGIHAHVSIYNLCMLPFISDLFICSPGRLVVRGKTVVWSEASVSDISFPSTSDPYAYRHL
jgi:hypothetical protein